MAQTTDPTPTGTEPDYGWCHWHKGASGTAVLVQVIEQGSGPGAALYACAPCREQRNLTPYAEQGAASIDRRVQAAYSRYIDHLMRCDTCDSPTCKTGTELRQAWRAAQQAVAA